jgi:hypothetical protein
MPRLQQLTIPADSVLKHSVLEPTTLINVSFSENNTEDKPENRNSRTTIKLAEISEDTEELVENLHQYVLICVLLRGQVNQMSSSN